MRFWGRRFVEFCVFCLLAGAAQTAIFASESSAFQSGRKWNGKTVRLLLSQSLIRQSAAIKTGSDVDKAARSAAGEWQRAANIQMVFGVSDLESVSHPRSGGDGTSLVTVASTSENLSLFPDGERSAPAYTRLFFDRRGSIVEADVVLNPYIQFSTDGTPETYDLQSVLTHEFGHVLGLGHSPAAAATMFGRLSPTREGTNRGLVARTLAISDISAIRSVYGPEGDDIACCASVLGTVGSGTGGPGVVWAEEVDSGRIVAAVEARGGDFDLSGFALGRYRLLSQMPGRRGASMIMEKEFDLPTAIRRAPDTLPIEADITRIGTNGELGVLPVTMDRGGSFEIFIGGLGLDPARVRFGVSGSLISVADGSVKPVKFEGGLDAVALVVTVDPNTPDGEYSVFVESSSGARRYLLGSISVE